MEHRSRRELAAAALGCVLAFSLAACGSTQTAQTAQDTASTSQEESSTVTIQSLNGAGETIDLEVPKSPERVAILDLASLDIIDNLGEGDSVVGTATTTLDYLQKYVTDESIANLGNVKQADLEAVAACDPDIIFIGGRLSASYDELSEIAPVVYLSADSSDGVYAGTKAVAEQIAKIFGDEDKVDSLFSDFDARIETLKEAAAGKTAVIGMATAGSFNVIGNDGRLSLIVNEIGFENLGASVATSSGSHGGSGSGQGGSGSSGSSSSGGAESNPHGTESSFETVASLDPDYIFVLDRDSAIGTEGAQLAADVMNNDIINSTRAAQEGHMIVLAHPAAWYTAEGGITALDYMLSDLEATIL